MLFRSAVVASLAAALAVSAACGSSATTTTKPSALNRCSLTLSTPDQTIPATGGTGAIGVSATRDCTWTVSVDGTWLSLRSSQNGQGDGTVEFTAAGNPDPAMRRGALVLNGQRAEITQAAALCDITLAQTAGNFSPSGGNGRVDVRASSALCTWNVESDQPWIIVRSGTAGRGSGFVAFDVAPTSGPPRAGTLTIAGQNFSVTQSEGCTYAIAPATLGSGAQGTRGTIAVTTAPACPWTASSNVSWIEVGPELGSGPGAVSVTVLPTNGPPRTGTAVIAGQMFTVTQSQGCVYQVQPAAHTVAAAGGTATVTVSTAQGCAWTATSDVSWMQIQSVSPGSGNGLVTFAVSASTGPSRTGTLTVAGQKVTVSQGQGCTYSVSPTQESVPSAGSQGRIAVTAADGCAWTASSGVSWITINSGATGTGAGGVTYTVAATTGPARSGTMTVAGQTVTVNQGQGCAFAIVPTSATVPDAGGPTAFDVQSSAGCAWTASSNQPAWITVASGASGNGNGRVELTVAANTGPARSGTVTAAGQTFTVNQGASCAATLTPLNAMVPNAGGTTAFDVQTNNGCTWTASSNQPSWITISSGASGNGNGRVELAVAANSGPSRTGTVTAANQTFTVNQGAGCTFAIAPGSENVAAAGATGAVTVTTQPGCGWQATSNALWLSINGSASGSGDGSLSYTAAGNTGSARSGTLTIAGHTFTVNQAGGCTFTVTPETMTSTSAGGQARVDVGAAADCTWTAASNAAWLTIPPTAGGTGPGFVDVAAAANTGPARTGTLTVAGRTVTVNQDSGCTYSVDPSSTTLTSGAGSGSVTVRAGTGCGWTATVSQTSPWIAITGSASGSGDGAVQFTVEANTTGAARSGTISVSGATFTVNQQ